MSIDSPKHWLPPALEPDDISSTKTALFMETRSYLRRTSKRSAEKIAVQHLKPKHVNGLIDMYDEETFSLAPIINVSLRLRNKTAWILRSENVTIPINVYLSPDSNAEIFNAIHEPLRIKLAHDMVHTFIRRQIDALELQYKQRDASVTPEYHVLLSEALNEFGEELQLIHGQICCGDLK